MPKIMVHGALRGPLVGLLISYKADNWASQPICRTLLRSHDSSIDGDNTTRKRVAD